MSKYSILENENDNFINLKFATDLKIVSMNAVIILNRYTLSYSI